MNKKTIIFIILILLLLVLAGVVWYFVPAWYLPIMSLGQCTGKVTVKLNVPGKSSTNVADVFVYDPKDIESAKEALKKQLGSDVKISVTAGFERSPFVSLKVTPEILRTLEASDLVQYFTSSEQYSRGEPSGPEGMPTLGNPKFRWSYSKSCGYRAASSGAVEETCAGKILTPESVRNIYKSGCRNIPPEAKSF